jgi:hypothetical protein
MPQVPVSPSSRRVEAAREVPLDRLADCVRRLDPATRALLDLSVRRHVPDAAMAPVLRTDPFHLAWRRARALERIADEVGEGGSAPLGEVRIALEALPREAWGLPGMGPPALPAPRREGVPAAPWQRALEGQPRADEAMQAAQRARADLEQALAELTAPRARKPGPPEAAAPTEPVETSAAPVTGTALVPTASTALDTPVEPRPGRRDRLDGFASESPALRLAVRQLGRALAAKAVRLVVWRRRSV